MIPNLATRLAVYDTIVGATVRPQRDEAMLRAEQFAREQVLNVRKLLEANDWQDLRVAPYPSHLLSRPLFLLAQIRHQLVSSLTQWAEPSRIGNSLTNYKGEPYTCTMPPKLTVAFIEKAREDAAYQYDLFAIKLVGKVGPGVKSAMLEGSHVWSHSFLTVQHLDDAQVIWKTQSIMNVSKFGKVYAQFPTRIVKEKV